MGGDSVDAEFEDLAADRFLLGTPEDVTEEIRRYRREFGIDHLVVRSRWPGMPTETERESLGLFAEEVMPRFE